MLQKVMSLPTNHGYNALSDEYVDMYASGILDPMKVTRFALESAASIGAMLLTTEAIIAESRRKISCPDARWRHGLLRSLISPLTPSLRGGFYKYATFFIRHLSSPTLDWQLLLDGPHHLREPIPLQPAQCERHRFLC